MGVKLFIFFSISLPLASATGNEFEKQYLVLVPLTRGAGLPVFHFNCAYG